MAAAKQPAAQVAGFAATFQQFRRLLTLNNAVLEKIGRMESALAGEYVFDRKFLTEIVDETNELVREVVYCLNRLTRDGYLALYDRYAAIADQVAILAAAHAGPHDRSLVLPYAMLNSDFEELVGSKNATVCEIGNRLQLPVPRGFAITVAAYREFMAENDLFARIDAVCAAAATTSERAARIAELFAAARPSAALAQAVDKELAQLRRHGGEGLTLAVRSSGVGEDGETRSFAGQFRSVLAVPPEPSAVLAAYQQVVASRFSVAALEYLGPATASQTVPMAVAVQPMVAGQIAGVTYSRNPDAPERQELLITAVRGEGRELVAGRQTPDRFTVSRVWPFPLLASEVVLSAATEGRDPLALLPNGLRRGSAALTPAELMQLAAQAVLLEKAFGEPQDIEWAMQQETPVILQSRPFGLPAKPPPLPAELTAELAAAEPLLRGKGQVAQLGIAAGRVVPVDQETAAESFPVGAIAVARFPSPRLSPIVWRAAAIITDVGGPTGHLATIAREYRTPALFGVGDATKLLAAGEEVTVDVENKTVYRGIVGGLVRLQAAAKDDYQSAPELRILRRILRWVAPLTLADPTAPEFRADKCQTLHDILRFCHEKAIEALIHFHGEQGGHERAMSRPLRLPVPLKLRVIDLGGGLRGEAPRHGELELAMVSCQPLTALFQGFLRGGREADAGGLGLRDLLSSIGRPLSLLANWPAYAGDNLAIIADHYCNLSLRLGYHFNVVDAYMSPAPDNNYIYFRFVGGMAEREKRERRARLIGTILAGLYFKVERQGDLVVAKAKNLDPVEMARVLGRLGELIAFTRQLDVRMRDETAIEHFFAHFLAALQDEQHGGNG